MQIRVRVDKEVIILKREQLGTNNVNTIELMFELCEEFNNLTAIAIFTKDNVSYKVNIVDNKCLVPHEVLKSEGEVELGVYGFELSGQDLVKRYSPLPTKIFVKRGSYKEGQESTDASPNTFEFYLSACNNAKSSAEASASNAKNSANNAKISEEKAQTSENNAKTSEEEVENIKNSIITEESNRVENENIRVAAESERAIAEAKRLENEEQREENETDRIQAEETRTTAEIERATAEVKRNENEEIILENEKARIENENIRNANEETRVANENLRIANEMYREEERKVHNNMLYTLLKDMQIEDTYINVKDSADYPCTLNVEGKSEQDVTENSPSIDYPSPIENVEGNLEIRVVGENLAKVANNKEKVETGVPIIKVENDIVKINGTCEKRTAGQFAAMFSGNNIKFADYVQNVDLDDDAIVLKAGEYKLKIFDVTGKVSNQSRVRLGIKYQKKGKREANSFVFSTGLASNIEYSFKLQEESQIGIAINYIVTSGYVTFDNVTFKCALYKSDSTMSKYEPYKEQTVTFPLAEGQKMYKDSYLAEDGIHHKRRHFSLAVADMNNSEEYPGWRNLPNLQDDFPGKNDLLSDVTNYCSNVCKSQDKNLCINTNGNGATMFFKANLGLTQSQLKTQYSDLIVEVEYEMREKEETTAYTTEQQKAYEQIKALRTYRTVTNISNNQNTNMKLTYKKDLQTQLLELESMILESGV